MPAPTQVSKLPKSDTCTRDPPTLLIAHEAKRHIAALDAEVRRTGGLVLPLRSYAGISFTGPRRQVGQEFRGPKGERLMIVGTYDECSVPPSFVLTEDYEIFEALPTIVGKKKHVATFCSEACGGCGTQPADQPAIAEVPEGSRVVERRPIDVPIATEIVFRREGMCMPAQ